MNAKSETVPEARSSSHVSPQASQVPLRRRRFQTGPDMTGILPGGTWVGEPQDEEPCRRKAREAGRSRIGRMSLVSTTAFILKLDPLSEKDLVAAELVVAEVERRGKELAVDLDAQAASDVAKTGRGEGRQGGVVGLQEALLFVRQSYLAIEVEALLVSYGSKRLPRCPPAVTSRE